MYVPVFAGEPDVETGDVLNGVPARELTDQLGTSSHATETPSATDKTKKESDGDSDTSDQDSDQDTQDTSGDQGSQSGDDDGYISADELTDESAQFIAHRGYSKIAPQNTVVAFEAAVEAGFGGLELDVWESKVKQGRRYGTSDIRDA